MELLKTRSAPITATIFQPDGTGKGPPSEARVLCMQIPGLFKIRFIGQNTVQTGLVSWGRTWGQSMDSAVLSLSQRLLPMSSQDWVVLWFVISIYLILA
jgi:hypothetical protein